MLRGAAKDAADDPAIWMHPTNPGRSIVIGTHTQGAVEVYDLASNSSRDACSDPETDDRPHQTDKSRTDTPADQRPT